MLKGYSHTPGRVYACLIALFVIFSWTSCSKGLTGDEFTDQSLLSTESSTETSVPQYCKTQTYCLTAGQTIESGSVTVNNDANNLYITVQSTGGFQSGTGNIKIWLGDDLDLLPVAGNGAPIPGQFPFHYDATGNSFTATIPLGSIDSYNGGITCSTKLYIFVHVDIIDPNGTAQTAWGGCVGKNIEEPGRWYYFDTYQGVCCTPPPPGCTCTQTAFAKGNINAKYSDHWVFSSDPKSNPNGLSQLNLTKNRWGWALNIKTPGSGTYNIWASAGLNNTSKGTLVGTLSVNWTGASVTVTYNMNIGYHIGEIHVYAGDLKPKTIAPGQYGNIATFNPFQSTYSATYNVSDSNGDGIWIIAHAGVSGSF